MPFLALLRLIPSKDWLYIAAIVALLSSFTAYTIHERHVGAAHQLAAVARASAKAEAAAKQQIQDLTDQHSRDVTAITGAYNHAIQTASVERDSDLKRLRDFDAYRKAHPALDGAGGSVTSDGAGGQSADGLGAVPAGLAAELADALRQDDAALRACYADRDSLTGK